MPITSRWACCKINIILGKKNTMVKRVLVILRAFQLYECPKNHGGMLMPCKICGVPYCFGANLASYTTMQGEHWLAINYPWRGYFLAPWIARLIGENDEKGNIVGILITTMRHDDTPYDYNENVKQKINDR